MSKIEDFKKQSEDQVQAEIFQTIWNDYPQTRRLLFAVPNGGSRDIREAMKLRATGVVPGIPDLIFIWRGRAYGIEVKTVDGTVSKAQKDVHYTWAGDGTPVVVVWSAVQGIDYIKTIING